MRQISVERIMGEAETIRNWCGTPLCWHGLEVVHLPAFPLLRQSFASSVIFELGQLARVVPVEPADIGYRAVA
jgi:hypothetical protein